MDFNKLTTKSQEAVAQAQELARRSGNPEIYPEHLLLALLEQELSQQLVPDPPALRAEAEAKLAVKPSAQGGAQQPQVSRAFSQVLDRASDEARKLGDDYVSTEHLLLALDVVPRHDLLAAIKRVPPAEARDPADGREPARAAAPRGRRRGGRHRAGGHAGRRARVRARGRRRAGGAEVSARDADAR